MTTTRDERRAHVKAYVTPTTPTNPDLSTTGYEAIDGWRGMNHTRRDYQDFEQLFARDFGRHIKSNTLTAKQRDELFAMMFHLYTSWFEVLHEHNITLHHQRPHIHVYQAVSSRVYAMVNMWEHPNMMDRGYHDYHGSNPIAWGEESGLTRAERIVMHNAMDAFTSSFHTIARNTSDDTDALRKPLILISQAFTQALIYWANDHQLLPALAFKQT